MATLSEALTLASAQQRAGRFDLAAEICRRVLAVEPDQPEALHLLGQVVYQQGQRAAAVDYFRRAIAARPTRAVYHNSLGNALKGLGLRGEAIACYERALQLSPRLADVHYNLGNTWQELGRLPEAADAYRRCLAITPHSARAHNNLGNTLQDLGQADEAAACYRRALELQPDYVETHTNLGTVRKNQGQLAEALACYDRAIALRPDDFAAQTNRLYALHFSPAYDARAIGDEARRWNARFAAPLQPAQVSYANTCQPDRRLRVGYVSPDFRAHPVGRFLLPLLEAHDHRQFEIFCYSSLLLPDAVTDRLHAAADVWRDVALLADAQLAQAIREDQIDILVDLTMHMAGCRLLAFARRPAPVQVTYLAYCSTTGLDAIDYRLTDPYLDPPASDERCYSEQSVRLPETYWCYRPSDETPPLAARPALAAGRITFGCLNQFCKVTEPTLAAWCRLLRAVPQSRLLLHAHEGGHRDRTRALLERHGIEPDRLAFVGFLSAAAYFPLYQQIDVALDPFPYGGGTTTCDALWMGVPVVSLAGQTAVGRGGLSILSNLGLAELVATDVDQYVQIAAALAQDRSRRTQLRLTLRTRMQQSPLMDAPRFAGNVEAAYRALWHRWCATRADENRERNS
jgi:predicted O-linked N-acetylglucosamine transferase (SPINDLY family)